LGPVGPVDGPVVLVFFVVLGLLGPVVGPDPGPDTAVVVYFINYLIFLNFLLL
jgi:hypothetical protein